MAVIPAGVIAKIGVMPKIRICVVICFARDGPPGFSLILKTLWREVCGGSFTRVLECHTGHTRQVS